MSESVYETVFAIFVFVLGAAVGSFLNVCIYRLPRDLSVNQPRRSFCPSCQKEISWRHNIPLFSWLFLRARCANCKAPISARYFLVELLTALLFLAVWQTFPPVLAVIFWLFVALVIVATFVDFEHFIIPDEITIGGAIAGILFSVVVPELMGEFSRGAAFVQSLAAAVLGYLLLWGVLEAGKLAFGKKRIRLDEPQPFSWTRQGDDAEFVVGQERGLWSDHFARETDLLVMNCNEANIDGHVFGPGALNFHYNRVAVAGETFELDKVDSITGIVDNLQIPREAMGRGDLKFLACIGAFLGWRGVLFTVFAGSLIGSLVGVTMLLVGKRAWSTKLPFGPYLSAGALIWMFFGPQLIDWYIGYLRAPEF